jgi:phage-related protein
MPSLKPVVFRGGALRDLRNFPEDAKREAGYQLDKVQRGKEPDDWKPMKTVGKGVQEIRIWDAAGTFRVIYIASLPDAIYVLHCFKKTTEQTSQSDIDLASERLSALSRELGQ